MHPGPAGSMEVKVNGERRQVAPGISLSDLVRNLGLEGTRLAVERNGLIVPRDRYPETRLAPGDTLEIVQFVGGG